MGLIRTELMPDSSEVVPYDHAGIPLYIRAAHLASYYNMCAPCHWHDDIEQIYIISCIFYSCNVFFGISYENIYE